MSEPLVSSFPVQLVGYNVDTLYLNVRRRDSNGSLSRLGIDDDLAMQLDDVQVKAKEQEHEVVAPWSFGGAPLMMQTHGAGRGQLRWLLTSPLLDLSISQGKLKGHILAQVRLSSRYLWSQQTPGLAICDIEEFLSSLFPYRLHLQVSEVHLCADIVGWDIGQANWQEGFVSRAVSTSARPDETDVESGPCAVRCRWKKLTTLEFGSHSSRLSCSIYNKSVEIQRSGKQWFEDIWKANGWDGEAPVWRVEFRFRREFLRVVGVEWAYDLMDMMKLLWDYAAGHATDGEDGLPDGWLRYVIPNPSDTTRSRWPVHPAWRVVQRAFSDDAYSHVGSLVFKREKEVNVSKQVAAVAGYISSIAAQGGDLYPELNGDLDEVMTWMTQAVALDLHTKERVFLGVVRKKRPQFVRLPGKSLYKERKEA